MTYSQRLTHGNTSDIIYLEHQIGIAEEELATAVDEQRAYEAELHQLRTSTAAPSTPGTNVSNEQELVTQINRLQSMIKDIRTRLTNLEDDLGKLED